MPACGRSSPAIAPRAAFTPACRPSRRRSAGWATAPRCSVNGISVSRRGRARTITASTSGSASWLGASTTTRTYTTGPRGSRDPRPLGQPPRGLAERPVLHRDGGGARRRLHRARRGARRSVLPLPAVTARHTTRWTRRRSTWIASRVSRRIGGSWPRCSPRLTTASARSLRPSSARAFRGRLRLPPERQRTVARDRELARWPDRPLLRRRLHAQGTQVQPVRRRHPVLRRWRAGPRESPRARPSRRSGSRWTSSRRSCALRAVTSTGTSSMGAMCSRCSRTERPRRTKRCSGRGPPDRGAPWTLEARVARPARGGRAT